MIDDSYVFRHSFVGLNLRGFFLCFVCLFVCCLVFICLCFCCCFSFFDCLFCFEVVIDDSYVFRHSFVGLNLRGFFSLLVCVLLFCFYLSLLLLLLLCYCFYFFFKVVIDDFILHVFHLLRGCETWGPCRLRLHPSSETRWFIRDTKPWGWGI